MLVRITSKVVAQSGSSIVEYSLLVALFSMALLVSIAFVRREGLGEVFSNAGNAILSAAGDNNPPGNSNGPPPPPPPP